MHSRKSATAATTEGLLHRRAANRLRVLRSCRLRRALRLHLRRELLHLRQHLLLLSEQLRDVEAAELLLLLHTALTELLPSLLPSLRRNRSASLLSLNSAVSNGLSCSLRGTLRGSLRPSLGRSLGALDWLPLDWGRRSSLAALHSSHHLSHLRLLSSLS